MSGEFNRYMQCSNPEELTIEDAGSWQLHHSQHYLDFEFKKALCDSGASINLMPLSVVNRLNLGELTPIAMTLQMSYRTIAQPEEVLEDVLIKVGKFIVPVDFVIMDMEEDTQVPLLLGRPFLAIGAALIYVKNGEFTQGGRRSSTLQFEHKLKTV